MANFHIGSWGTPEFGVTEWIGKQIAKVGGGSAPLTSQGGSSLFGKSSEIALAQNPYTNEVYNLSYTPSTQKQSGTLGTQTVNNPNPNPNPTGGGTSLRDQFNQYIANGGYAGWDLNSAWADFQAKGGNVGGSGGGTVDEYINQQRQAIESGYSDYFASLDRILNEYLPAQQTAQRQLAEEQYTSGVAQLQPQLQAGQTQLARQREQTETNQAKNLRDLSANLRNAFMAGNVYLGGLGAGDSSAAGQYAYALTKLGSQQRGNVMTQTADILNQINDRETNLQNVYNAEVNRLLSEKNQKISQIADWFASQQASLQQAKASGSVSKAKDLAAVSQNLLNIALNQLQTVQQETANRRAALDTWALNNATNINQVKQNLQNVSNYSATLPQVGQLVGQPIAYAGGFNVPAYGYSGRVSEEDKNKLFYNPLA